MEVEEKQRIELKQNFIYLRIHCDFDLNQDIATFYYSPDGENWTQIGSNFKMIFDYRKLFMGTRFAIFNYAKKEPGGYVDIDFFDYQPN